MTVLIPMRAEAFDPYVQASIENYAQSNVDAGRWPRQGALQRSQADFGTLLPQGLATPDHYLFEILDSEGGPVVGCLWIAAQHEVRTAFVYDVVIHPEHRRQGHATRAFAALEPVVRARGLSSIGLHVFGHNSGAQALYRKLGYAVTGINMLKAIQ